MRYIFIITLFYSTLFAGLQNDLKTINQMYKENSFKKACRFGANKIIGYKRSEKFISLYAFSCLKSDQIDKLASATALLKHSPEARANSVYFSTILLQKKLLLHAMIDDFKIKQLQLPSTDYVLSKVFDLFMKEDKSESSRLYEFIDSNNPAERYRLFVKNENENKKVIIEHYLNDNLIKTHQYW